MDAPFLELSICFQAVNLPFVGPENSDVELHLWLAAATSSRLALGLRNPSKADRGYAS